MSSFWVFSNYGVDSNKLVGTYLTSAYETSSFSGSISDVNDRIELINKNGEEIILNQLILMYMKKFIWEMKQKKS